ncbi:MAG: site-specific DNA-methyltransferase, partial [Candidatus Moranbacteria bacterium]|nr:site-specific DNA-methyltransferase [Candidatus Moranbacteria bacterium]
MPKINKKSSNIIQERIDKLKELFPDLFDHDGNLNEKELKALVQNYSVPQVEKFVFEWAGKQNSKKTAFRPSKATLEPDKKRSVDFEKTENLIIEGDNLEVLKLLRSAYFERVKCIYIDPPYNTGNDFIYNDNFSEDKQAYWEKDGTTKDGVKLDSNSESKGRYHSDWLNMMQSRLLLARNLLREDGVIFVSIDDNEVHNLRKLMDEIFGEENFVGIFIKQSKVGGGSDTKFIVKEHEYVVSYGKAIDKTVEFFTKHNEDYLKRYKEEDEQGKYFWDTFARPGLKKPINYDIKAPDGSIINGDWIRSKKRFDSDFGKGEIRIIKKGSDEWSVQFKQRLNLGGKKPRSLTSDLGGTIEGKNEIIKLFGNDKIFSYPKSVRLLKFLISLVIKENDLVLDFFAGSGTTAQAVMELNKEDGGNRKFILVQVPEETDEKSEAYKAGYKKISDICIER